MGSSITIQYLETQLFRIWLHRSSSGLRWLYFASLDVPVYTLDFSNHMCLVAVRVGLKAFQRCERSTWNSLCNSDPPPLRFPVGRPEITSAEILSHFNIQSEKTRSLLNWEVVFIIFGSNNYRANTFILNSFMFLCLFSRHRAFWREFPDWTRAQRDFPTI